MDFALTEAQLELAALTRKIVADQLTPALRESGAPELWPALAKAGVLSAVLPEDAGGSGFGLLEQCAVLVELGRAVAPVPYLPSIVAVSALATFGTADQRSKWLDRAASGEIVLSVALAEDLGDPTTSAERVDGGWVLTGAKTTVPAAAASSLFLVSAATADGPAVFLVEPHEVTITQQQLVDASDDAASLELSGLRLPDDRLLPGPDVADWLNTRYTVGLCASQLGVTERALELTAEYARTRVQFDRPIGSFQAVAQRLADAFVDVAAIRLTLWQAAWRLASDLPAETEVATAKFWAADAGHRVAHTAVHVHGGMGIDVSHELHRYFTAAKRNEFSLGGATTQLLRIGASLAANPA
ncbi:acyl-CoA dehydrogenase [Lentzea tibetensis]|uniref:Acyl-CoA dehydrogenase n=1 Tax=Lentzea tibetensis TaxID=2591470 RepID=A0A563F2A5_9PSEU|nr:acyl-CoA dehydrogenase family protein [Lentzea tibetensis]TWP54095.1 acyl-CoA dehydrogenase [Lentzea tibetensis]